MSENLTYRIQLRFNSRLKGAGQKLNGLVEAGSVQEAIDFMTAQAVRLPEHGQSIFVTGATVDQEG